MTTKAESCFEVQKSRKPREMDEEYHKKRDKALEERKEKCWKKQMRQSLEITVIQY